MLEKRFFLVGASIENNIKMARKFQHGEKWLIHIGK